MESSRIKQKRFVYLSDRKIERSRDLQGRKLSVSELYFEKRENVTAWKGQLHCGISLESPDLLVNTETKIVGNVSQDTTV